MCGAIAAGVSSVTILKSHVTTCWQIALFHMYVNTLSNFGPLLFVKCLFGSEHMMHRFDKLLTMQFTFQTQKNQRKTEEKQTVFYFPRMPPDSLVTCLIDGQDMSDTWSNSYICIF